MTSASVRRVGIVAGSVWCAAALGACGAGREAAGSQDAFTRTTDGGTVRLTVRPEAIDRLGITTGTVPADASTADGVEALPAGAVLYAPDGSTFVFTRGGATTFDRHPVRVERIAGGNAWVRNGPPPGSAVVTQGAAELTGMEFGLEDE
jgi:multidrug efflux pump subunit AcrA (membrane-fusion protein)